VSENISMPTGRSEGARKASKRATIHALVVVALFAMGVGGVRGLEVWMNAVFDKPPAELSKPLDELPKTLGSPPRYIAEKPDEIMDHEVVETLGTHNYLVRQYRDMTVKQGDPGEFINLNVNYYANGSSNPHVPEVCWAGAGRVEAPGSGDTFEVPDVKRKYGPPVTLRVRLISFWPQKEGSLELDKARKNAAGEQVYANVGYIFHVNGDYVSNAREVGSHFWKASNLYAYHCKIEMTPMMRTDPAGDRVEVMVCTREEAKRIITQFLQEVIQPIEECLPDPAILTKPSPAAAAGGSGTNTR